MDALPGDDWFDRIMLFIANNINWVCEGWFRIMGWMLTISALSFGANQAGIWYLYILPYGSVTLLWLWCLIGLLRKVHENFPKQGEGPELDLRKIAIPYITWMTLVLVSTSISSVVLSLSLFFASELSAILMQ